MILNAYAVLDGFLTVLRFGLSLCVIRLGFSVWRRWRGSTGESRTELEDRCYLLFLLALLLLAQNLLSWPLLYLLLESYVPEWPGVMCIYGVTQIGQGSLGPSRHLPGLLLALQTLKPILVFISGAWLVLYRANRRTQTDPLMGRILVILMGMGILALIDASLEAAYLVIPKKEEFVTPGCCTAAQGDDSRFLPHGVVGEKMRVWLYVAYYGVNGGIILTLAGGIWKLTTRQQMPRLGLLLLLALLGVVVTSVFLIDVAAPIILHLPHHHCLYDLLPRAPESVLGVVLFFCGTFAVGWACVAAWFADHPEARPFLAEQVRRVLVVGLFAYLGSIIVVSIELALS